MRVNYIRYQAKLGRLYDTHLPGAKVMPDPSTFLSEMNGYLMYKEDACDFIAFHSDITREEPLWTYFCSMN
jgi:hypothetical protein